MKCPRDQELLIAKTMHGTEVHACEQCGGMFLDEGELNRIAEPTAGDLEFSTVDLESFEHTDDSPQIYCPRDSAVLMSKVEFLVYTNIILDYCRRCHGFWLDGRELARVNDEVKDINEAAKSIPDPPMLRLAEFFWNLPVPR